MQILFYGIKTVIKPFKVAKCQPIAKCHHKDHKTHFSVSEPYGNIIDN